MDRPDTMVDQDTSTTGQEADTAPRARVEPSWRELFASNLKVVGAALAFAAMAYMVWRGLRLLFPDINWLQ
ncbi:MAG: hypothetical protein ACI841_002232 [Planctomycetota bacterium]|jgi:hypothetical protein